jgi:hypothetical protein
MNKLSLKEAREYLLEEQGYTEEDLQEMSPVEIIDLYEMYKEEDD